MSRNRREAPARHIGLADGASVHCLVDDFLMAWDRSIPMLMMHGFAGKDTIE